MLSDSANAQGAHLRMNTQILSTSQANSSKVAFLLLLQLGFGAFDSIGDQSFELNKCLFNFGNSSRAIYELPSRRVELRSVS